MDVCQIKGLTHREGVFHLWLETIMFDDKQAIIVQVDMVLGGIWAFPHLELHKWSLPKVPKACVVMDLM